MLRVIPVLFMQRPRAAAAVMMIEILSTYSMPALIQQIQVILIHGAATPFRLKLQMDGSMAAVPATQKWESVSFPMFSGTSTAQKVPEMDG